MMKGKKMKVYKVVERGHSCIVPHRIEVEYNIGQITYPKIENSPLFAFDNLENAKKFMEEMIGCAILLCEAEEWKERDLPFIPSAYGVGNTKLSRWWNENVFLYESEKWSLPKGTVLCKWIKPIERVE